MRRSLLILLTGWTFPVWAQIPSVGTSATLEVATWNVKWFGDPNNGPSDEVRQQMNVRDVIAQSAIDLWALQEVSDPAAFQALLDSLGSEYEGILGETAVPGVTQRVAFVYRRDVVQRRRVDQILTEFAEAFAFRPPLLLEAAVHLSDTTVIITFITLHMKAGAELDDYNRRREAAQRLKSRLDLLFSRKPMVILGDWNDELHASILTGFASPYENFRTDTDNYWFLTEPLDAANIPTWCGRNSTCRTGSTIDHILITDELFDAYEENSVNRFTALLDAIPGFVYSTSDHLPVYARFRFWNATGLESAVRPETTLQLYPNPARRQVWLIWEGRGTSVLIQVWDVLGRLVQTWERPVGMGRVQLGLKLEGLAAGVYWMEVVEGDRRAGQTLIRLP